MNPRRRSVVQAAAGLLATAALPAAPAMPVLRESDADAVALEYTADSSRLDPAKQPLFQPGSRCALCYFYQGSKSGRVGACTVFAGFRVSASGWCREFRLRSA